MATEVEEKKKPVVPEKKDKGPARSNCQKFDEQITHGLYVVKRAGAFIRKFIDAQKSLVADLEKATKREKTKETGLKKDGMSSFVSSVMSLQTMVGATIKRHQEFVNRATKDVLQPLQDFYASGEKQRAIIAKKESKLRESLEKHLHNLVSLRKDCMSLHSELFQLKKSRDADEPASPKQQKTDLKLKEKAKKANKFFATYEKSVVEFNTEVQKFYSTAMPELLQEFEKLELERLKLLKERLTLFATIYAENLLLENSPEIKEQMDKLNPDTDATALKESLSHADPPAIPDPLPCKSNDFNSDAWLNPGNVTGGIASPPGSPVSSPLKQRTEIVEDMHSAPLTEVADVKVNEAPLAVRNSVAGIQEQARPEAPSAAAADAAMFCRGLYDFATEHPADLKFRVNDVIRVLTPGVVPSTLDPSNPQWLMGEVLSQEKQVMATGSFPSNYVEFFPGTDLDSYLLNVQAF